MLVRLKKLLHEMRAPVLFFFIAFSLVDIGDIVLNKSAETISYSFLVIFVASLVMAKIVLLSDFLPFINAYSHKPLIYSTVWKTFIYLLCSLVVRGLERLIPQLLEEKDLSQALHKMALSFDHLMFWVSQIWLASILFIFVALRELVNAVGKEKIRKLFFG